MKLGDYELQNELGRGGAGVVFRASNPSGAAVAIKLLLQASPERLARFRREERLLRTLGEAEGFVPLLELGESPRGPFFVMPLLEGGTLRERIRRGVESVPDALALGITLATAVGRAHGVGIVHRDLKPENVLFARDGRAFVSDLGLAKHFRQDVLGASQSAALTRSNELLGTFGYMAPEQTKDPASVGPAADVFALGAILYELLAGESPFDAETAVEVLTRSSSGEFVPIRRRRPDVPARLAALIERCLAPAPANRPADGSELARLLEEVAATPERQGPSLLLLVGVGVALVGLGLTAGLVLARGPRVEAAPLAPPPTPRPPTPARTPAPRPTPTPSPTPSPRAAANALPAACDSFRETKRTRLVSVLGSYAGRNLAMVQELKLGPDGRTVLSAALDGWAVLWDIETGEERFARQAPAPLYSCAISPDGRTVIGGDGNGKLHVFDVAGGGDRTLDAHEHAAFSLDVTPDGRSVWTGGGDGDFVHVDLASGQHLASYKWGVGARPLPGWAGFLLESDGKLALASLESGTARTLPAPEDLRVMGFAVSPDGKRALTGTARGAVALWDLETGEVVKVLEGHTGNIGEVAFSPDGRLAVTASFDGTGRIWDLATFETRHVLRGHAGWFVRGKFSADGKRVVTGGNDQTVRTWDVETGRELRPIVGHAGKVAALAASEDGVTLHSGGYDQIVRTWHLAHPGEPRAAGRSQTWINGLALLPGTPLVVSVGGVATADRSIGEVVVSDSEDGHKVAESVASVGFIQGVGALAADRWVTLADVGATACELATWKLDGTQLGLGSRRQLKAKGRAIAASRAKGRVAVVLEDGTTAYYRGETLEPEGGIAPTKVPGSALAFSPDGDTLAVGFLSGDVLLWDVPRGQLVKLLTRQRGAITALAFLEGGRALAACAQDGGVVLFDVPSGDELDRIDLRPTRDWATAIAPLGADGFSVGTMRGVILRFSVLPR